MGEWNQDALRAVAAIRTRLKELSPDDTAALDAAIAAIENDGKSKYSKAERARAHEAIAKIERRIGARAREEVDKLKGAFELTLGPET